MRYLAHEFPILIVEDNPDNRQLASWILEDANYKALEADSGEKALELLDKQTFSLVLMDISLPGMDGKDAIKFIRQRSDKSNIPIVALTAHTIDSEKQKIMESGANDIVTKPIDEDILLKKIADLLAT